MTSNAIAAARPEGKNDSVPSLRFWFGVGIGVLSFSVLQLQLLLVKVASFLFWHHFAYAIISLALLGLGAAGTYLTLKWSQTTPTTELISRTAFIFGLTVPLSYMLATRIRFEPLVLLENNSEHFSLLFIFAVLAVPFFFAGISISGAMKRYSSKANQLYAFDLAGAGLGCLSVFFLLRPLGATGQVLFLGLLGIVASYLLGNPGRDWRWPRVICLILMGAVLITSVRSKQDIWPLTASSAKDIQQSPVPITVEYVDWDPIARVDVTKPVYRKSAPAFSGVVSGVWHRTRHEERQIYQDAAAGTPLYKFNGNYQDEMPFMKGTLTSAPYEFLSHPRVMVIGAGGCPDVHSALANGACGVIAVEINSGIVRVLKGPFGKYGGDLASKPTVTLVNDEGRSYVRRFEGTVDIIQLSGVDTFAALASGAYSLAENYLYTTEAINDYYSRLSDKGVLSITRWIFEPPRETIRLVVTMIDSLEQMKMTESYKHIYIIKGFGWANTLMKKTPFTEEECLKLREFTRTWRYETVYDPYLPQDNEFNTYLRGNAPQRQEMIKNYPFRITSCTDDKPFFFQWYRWSSIFSRPGASGIGGYHITRFPIGNFIMLITLVQVTILAALFILYPLRSYFVRSVEHKLPLGLFFACLGFGFMFIEICLIQKLVLFLGHPSYSISVTLFSLLTFAAVGSAIAGRIRFTTRSLGILMIAVVITVLLTLFSLDFVLDALLGQKLTIRILASVLCLAPVAIMLGMPFASAIRLLSNTSSDQLVPWFWGINGFSSVIASNIAVFLAITFGFVFVIVAACLLYIVGAFIIMVRLPAIQTSA